MTERTEQLAWIPAAFDDVLSDLSRFHRVADWRALTGPQFLRLVERLPAYDGAVAVTFRRVLAANEQGEFDPPAAPRPAAAPDVADVGDDTDALVAIAAQGKPFGFGGIEIRS